MLQTDVFGTPSGPVVRFLEAGAERQNAAVLRRMDVIRPTSVTIRRPPKGALLGRLEFFVGPRTCATCDDRRTLQLRRGEPLGGGAFLLASASGARVVLSTRDRARFLQVSLPDRARNVALVLKARGARMLRFRCSRPSFRFVGRFTQIADVDRDASSVSRSRVRHARLC